MTPIRALEVLGKTEHVCRDCGRPICPGEYKTEVVYYGDGACWSEYSCCCAPHRIRTTAPREAFKPLPF